VILLGTGDSVGKVGFFKELSKGVLSPFLLSLPSKKIEEKGEGNANWGFR
jgi:hypothetical protein